MKVTGYILAALLLAVFALPVSSQPLPANLSQIPRGEVKIKEANLTFLLYPDGGVQTAYRLRAVIEASGAPGASEGFEAIYVSHASAKEDRYSSSLNLVVNTYAASVEKTLNAHVTIEANYAIDAGVSLDGRLHLEARNATRTTRLSTIFHSKIGADTIEARFEGLKNCTTIKELFEKIGFVEASCVKEDGSYTLVLKASTAKIFSWLRSAGMSDAEIEAIATLLTRRYGIRGEARLELVLNPSGLKVSFSDQAKGKIRDYLRDLQDAQVALAHAAIIAAYKLAEKSGYKQLAEKLGQLSMALQFASITPRLYPQPPYESKTKIRVDVRGRSATLDIDVVSAKVSVKAGSPKERLRETLRVMVDTLLQLKAALTMLDAYIHGVSDLIPNYVILKGVDCVKVEPSRARLSEIPDALKISIECRGGATATQTASEARTSTPAGHQATPTQTVKGGIENVGRASQAGQETTTTEEGNMLVTVGAAAAAGALVGAIAAYLVLRRGGA